MPYSANHRAIFIWIPKTAGTSLGAALESLDVFHRLVEEDLWGRIAEEERSRWRTANLQHLCVEGVKHYLIDAAWEDCYSFSFVRNPWDRLVSFYEYSRTSISNPDSIQYGKAPLGSFEQWFEESPIIDQLYYLRDRDGQIPINFIGRFETLGSDFAKVCDDLGLPQASLPKLRASKRGNYRDYYDTALKKKVAEKYAEEIEVFKYVF